MSLPSACSTGSLSSRCANPLLSLDTNALDAELFVLHARVPLTAEGRAGGNTCAITRSHLPAIDVVQVTTGGEVRLTGRPRKVGLRLSTRWPLRALLPLLVLELLRHCLMDSEL